MEQNRRPAVSLFRPVVPFGTASETRRRRHSLEIRIGFDIACHCPEPTPAVLMLHVHPDRRDHLIDGESLHFSSLEPVHHYRDTFGNICSRIILPAGVSSLRGDAVVRDHGQPDPVVSAAEEVPIARLPDEVLLYLMGSRYCETDELTPLAWNLFGGARPGWARVQAICDFVHGHIAFAYSNARSTRSAVATYNERTGVCRDFAQLAITLCRAMNIPARYCTGYLGDIGVPAAPYPMDFSAWFEVFLGGGWYTFDARHNVPRIGRVVMARGRDAADVPMITTFGPHTLRKFTIVTDEVLSLAAPVG
jgi:transglutaminase-like putative cysteine protease